MELQLFSQLVETDFCARVVMGVADTKNNPSNPEAFLKNRLRVYNSLCVIFMCHILVFVFHIKGVEIVNRFDFSFGDKLAVLANVCQ